MAAGSTLALAILRALAGDVAREQDLGAATGMSLPRLSKHLGLSASVVLRELALMGDAPLGGAPGPGWVVVTQHEGQWRAKPTLAGYRVARRC